ncbi:MAG: type IV secretory system conjugative DNA transfer family protein [Eubacterium coprostanoligenes]|nr:type IV secretory system conjugative DNA transfer family protein [Eubacterium coprostanoligenes]
MKKLLCVLMATAMIFTVFSACSKPTENDKPTTEAPTTAKATTGFNTDTEGLMTPDEVRMMDNKYALIFIRGERPIMDLKYDILKHPNIKFSADGGAEPYEHA